MGVEVGERRLPLPLAHQVGEKLTKYCALLFLTDGLAEYGQAILIYLAVLSYYC